MSLTPGIVHTSSYRNYRITGLMLKYSNESPARLRVLEHIAQDYLTAHPDNDEAKIRYEALKRAMSFQHAEQTAADVAETMF